MAKITKVPHSLITFATGAVLGLILALILTTIFLSYRIDKYHQQIEALQTKLIERELQLEKLNESLDKKKFILKDIRVIINSSMDEDDSILIQTTLKQKLSTLIGKEVKNIDTELISEVVDKRIMKTDIVEYKLRLKRLVLSDTLSIWVEAEIL
jgi:hypothetical protein